MLQGEMMDFQGSLNQGVLTLACVQVAEMAAAASKKTLKTPPPKSLTPRKVIPIGELWFDQRASWSGVSDAYLISCVEYGAANNWLHE